MVAIEIQEGKVIAVKAKGETHVWVVYLDRAPRLRSLETRFPSLLVLRPFIRSLVLRGAELWSSDR